MTRLHPKYSAEDWAEIERIELEEGGEIAGPDDPIYSEGPSITFLSRTPESSAPRGTTSTRTSTPRVTVSRRARRR